MNIAFDATAILGPMSKNRGIGNYALGQFKTMIEKDTSNNYFLLNFYEDIRFKDYLSRSDNFEEYYYYCGQDNFLLRNPDYKQIIGDIIKKFLKEHKIDVFYITSPFDGSNVLYEKKWFDGVRVIATVYDIIPYIFKDKYLADRISYKWYMSCVDMLRWMDKLLVISNSVKEDLINYLNFSSDKIDVIYGAVNEKYRIIDISKNEKEKLFHKYGITSNYIMCTGGDDERKNIQGLIVAYSAMPRELIDKYQLVIVCKLSPEAVSLYTNIIKDNNVVNRVILTNFVTDEELIQLYNLAYLMAFPSKYEGFGLPIVESWACGTPVLTSNNSSLGEIAGDAAILVDPFDIKDITRGLVTALTEVDLSKLMEKAKNRLVQFQWPVVAENVIKAFSKISICEKVESESRKKIAFFTPLPPIQSGISDYSVDIIKELSNYFDIDVYIDTGYKPTCKLSNNVNIYIHKEFKKKSNEYFDIIYQMGNSEYHEYMEYYIKKYKGTLVLHDYNLHSLVRYLTLFKRANNIKLYRQYLLEDFDIKIVDEYIDKLTRGEIPIQIHQMEVNGYVVNYSNKIIVHSNEAREKLLTRNIGRNVRTIRLYAKIEPLSDSIKTREKYNILKDEIIISSFGHIHESKRIIPALKAFSILCKEYSNIKYYFVGKLDPCLENEFHELVRNNNLENRIFVTGYTELDEFIEYIKMSDICVNLRYPYNGETSGSLMRILAQGKCVLVNDIGSFSEIPDSCCVKIPSVESMDMHTEVDKIYKALKKLIESPNIIKKIGFNARKYAEENLDIKVIGKQYRDFILEAHKPSLNEKHLKNIIDFEVISKQYNMEEISRLAKTLGYSKSTIQIK